MGRRGGGGRGGGRRGGTSGGRKAGGECQGYETMARSSSSHAELRGHTGTSSSMEPPRRGSTPRRGSGSPGWPTCRARGTEAGAEANVPEGTRAEQIGREH